MQTQTDENKTEHAQVVLQTMNGSDEWFILKPGQKLTIREYECEMGLQNFEFVVEENGKVIDKNTT